MLTEEKVLLFVHDQPIPKADEALCMHYAAERSEGLVVLQYSGYPSHDMHRFERLLSFQDRPTSYVTNQESVVLRALRLVREGRLKRENLRVFWYTPEAGTWVTCEVTDDGDLDNFPAESNLFEWRDDELF